MLKKIFGSKNDREMRRMRPLVERINHLESSVAGLSDAELQAKTAAFRTQLEQGATLDGILPEAFAVVREASQRVLGMRHYDVQLIGGMVLHQGKIAEMRTGEGKTLVSTLPAYLNALSGKGVHIVTVNDYLANRDAEWMGKIHRFLGLSVGIVVHGYDDHHKQEAYAADITYGTNSEFGFDYLRDNMKFALSEYAQARGLHYAVIDEVDSILIDEARTPLIISGPGEASTDRYHIVNEAVSKLRLERDYTVDEKSKSALLTDEGTDRVEHLLKVGNLFSPENAEWIHHVTKALAAHGCYTRDVDYLVRDGDVMIIDEQTGRTMEGRRWSDGLHQAIEAKEGVAIQRENMTLATITYQNFYRMYDKIAGMTGTADTEAEEFHKIYNLEVVVIPTNKAMVREDHHDLVFKTEAEKFKAVVEDIKECYEAKQPVLVGTRSVEKSEVLSRFLKKASIPHVVLNAKYHRQEGEIIAQAGQLGAVTLSTNMAGRGTDILLGGNPEYLARAAVAHEELGAESSDPAREQHVLAEYRWLSGSPDSVPIEKVVEDRTQKLFYDSLKTRSAEGDVTVADLRSRFAEEARAWAEHAVASYAKHLAHFHAECAEAKKKVLEAGGLHVLGTERHESRRVDNQLRGRAGRQGDPGSSQFYLSLEDDLMRLFGGDRLKNIMERMGMEDDVPIEARLVSRSIENAQKRVEGHNFDLRKNLIEYDDVMNLQRKTVYSVRQKVLGSDPMEEDVLDMVERVVASICQRSCAKHLAPEDRDLESLEKQFRSVFGAELNAPRGRDAPGFDELELQVYEAAEARLKEREAVLGRDFVVVEEGLVRKDQLDVTASITESVFRYMLRQIYLAQIDRHWRDHLTQMDHLREGIGLRGYASKDPKLEYKKEGHELFVSMLREVDFNVIGDLMHVQLMSREEVERDMARRKASQEALARAAQLKGDSSETSDSVAPHAASDSAASSSSEFRRKRPGRNDACWCGSGKKYKKCHLSEDEQNAAPSPAA
jgi:preprotein translocase subunit SecA